MKKDDVRNILLLRIYRLLPTRFDGLVSRWLLADTPAQQQAEHEVWSNMDIPADKTTRRSLQRVYSLAGIRRNSRLRSLWKIAAVVAILVLPFIGYGIYYYHQKPVEWISVSTANGQHCTVALPDGTTVILNAGSTLSYPKNFSHSARPVKLAGEAVFSVRHDEDKPFSVYAGGLVIRDLGTRFDVKSYPDGQTLTTLAEGSLSVSVKRSKGKSDAVILTPDQQTYYDRTRRAFIVKQVDAEHVLEWVNGTLSFSEEPLREVLSTLGRHYDVSFKISRKVNLNIPITLDIDSAENLQRTLEIMSLMTGMKYSITGKTVIVSHP
ncbi:MAG: FecR domain-containing protein [Prevotella sp.]|nr:FecR domain-containing protein [Prevotella sp.]